MTGVRREMVLCSLADGSIAERRLWAAYAEGHRLGYYLTRSLAEWRLDQFRTEGR